MKKAKKPIIEYFDEFFQYLDIERGLSAKSQETYQRFLSRFQDWLEKSGNENLKPHQLSDKHIWDYRVYLSKQKNYKKQPITKKTRNYYLIAVRNLLNFFADWDIEALPAEKVKLAKEDDKDSLNFLSLDQMRKLLNAPDDSKRTGIRDRAILETLFSTGLRVSELVDLDRDQINIKDCTDELEVVVTGKGDRTRTVYFSPRSIEALKKYLEIRDDDEDALFIRYRGPKTGDRRITTRSIENIVKKYVKQTGLPEKTTPHTLRHSYATDLLAQGVDLRVIQEFLGHKNIATTQIYTHITSKKLKEIHKKYHSGQNLKNNENQGIKDDQ
ncbi:MAG: tyrosine-type recombinase/integrase [Patescibacteria group bacterium]